MQTMQVKRDKLERRGRRLAKSLKFWTNLSRVTRFSLHGFVLMMMRRTLEKIVKYNTGAEAFNRQARKERRRNRALRRR